MTLKQLKSEALVLLQQLIATPSFSREENATADLIQIFLEEKGIPCHRKENNVWAFNRTFDSNKPSLLLNSHHDTVRPNAGYTRDPFFAEMVDGKLYGLGSNDAGGALVSLIATFLHFYEETMPYNLILACTAEEEISGNHGVECILSELGPLDCAIVGEPTQLQAAVAERGLLVLDCLSIGKAGHAAREEGDNALYKALPDIVWFQEFRFPKISARLGEMKMSVTQIQAGRQHNVVPDVCEFTVDIRVTDTYTHEEVLSIVQAHVQSEVKARSMRLRSSHIDASHPLVQSAMQLGKTIFGSLTCSDQALIPVASIKLGPGDSARSHTADEFIYVHEIEEGVAFYIEWLHLFFQQNTTQKSQ